MGIPLLSLESKMKLSRWTSTEKQEAILRRFLGNIEARCQEAIDLAAEARAAEVKLPFTNEQGELVQSGANNEMRRVTDHYIRIAQECIQFVSDRKVEDAFRLDAKRRGVRI